MALEKHAATAAHWSAEQYRSLFSAPSTRLILVIEGDAGVQGFLVARTLDPEQREQRDGGAAVALPAAAGLEIVVERPAVLVLLVDDRVDAAGPVEQIVPLADGYALAIMYGADIHGSLETCG